MDSLYPWQQEVWQALMRRQEQNSMPHALLFTGVTGMGKQEFAKIFLAAMLCKNPTEQAFACGLCKSCCLLQANHHPDVCLIQPEASDKPIKIDQVRSLSQFLLGTAQLGNKKIALLNQAEAMNLAAANALLKSLEEPEGNALLVLISSKPNLLLATIRSRCQLIQFNSDKRAKAWLADKVSVHSGMLLALADGGPLKALAMVEQLPVIEQFIASLLGLASQELKLSAVINLGLQVTMQDLFNWLIVLLSDIIKLKLMQDEKHLVFQTAKDQLAKLAFAANLTKLYNYLDQLLAQRQQLTANVNLNHQLLLERILYRWQTCWIETKSCP